MKAAWPLVPLGQVLTERREAPSDIDLMTGGVRIVDKVSFHDGKIHLRQSQETRTGMILVRPGDILVSGINAAKGAIALHNVGSTPIAATIHYGAYHADPSQASSTFLWWLLRSTYFRDLIAAHVPGGIKTELKSKRLLPIPVRLPPVDEQCRIVARIDELAAKVDEARASRRASDLETEALPRAILAADKSGRRIVVGRFASLRPPDVRVLPTEQYHFAGVYSFGRGVFPSVRKMGSEFAYPRLTRLHAGNFVYPKLMAWEGALGVVPPNCDQLVVSTEFPVFELDEGVMLPEVIDTYFRSPAVWPSLSGQSGGTNVRRRRLNPKDFLKLEIPWPDTATQKAIRLAVARLSSLKKLQDQTAVELDSMLPAILDKAFKGEL